MPKHGIVPAGTVRFLAFAALVFIIGAAFTAVEPRFLSTQNISAVTRHMAANGLAALGLTLVVIVRKFDLSFAGTACFSAMTIGFMIAGGHDLWLCIMAGVLAAAIVGAFNGIAISYFGLPDIVTTIATGSIAGAADGTGSTFGGVITSAFTGRCSRRPQAT